MTFTDIIVLFILH